MSLMPSLANIFGYCDPDRDRLRQVREAMNVSGEFEQIAAPAEEWIVGWKCLPDSDPFGREFTNQKLAFAEGRDRLTDRDAERDKTDARFRHPAAPVTGSPR